MFCGEAKHVCLNFQGMRHSYSEPYCRYHWKIETLRMAFLRSNLAQYTTYGYLTMHIVSYIWKQICFTMQTSTLLQMWMLKMKLKESWKNYHPSTLALQWRRVWRVLAYKKRKFKLWKKFWKVSSFSISFIVLVWCKIIFSSKKFLHETSIESKIVVPKLWDMPWILVNSSCLFLNSLHKLYPFCLKSWTIQRMIYVEGPLHLYKLPIMELASRFLG